MKMKYPYLVYRIIPGFYTNTEIQFVKDENLLKTKKGLTVFWDKKIYDKSGKIALKCREILQIIARDQSKKSKRSVCLVFSQDDCDYFEPDGSFLHSEPPPYFKLRLADGDYKTDITTNSGKIDKVEFRKIKDILTILIVCSFLFWNGCFVSKPQIAKHNPEKTKIQTTYSKRSKKNNYKKIRKKKSKPTARCRDGSLSFSASRRGSCSHHKGVAKWFR